MLATAKRLASNLPSTILTAAQTRQQQQHQGASIFFLSQRRCSADCRQEHHHEQFEGNDQLECQGANLARSPTLRTCCMPASRSQTVPTRLNKAAHKDHALQVETSRAAGRSCIRGLGSGQSWMVRPVKRNQCGLSIRWSLASRDYRPRLAIVLAAAPKISNSASRSGSSWLPKSCTKASVQLSG